MELEPVLIPDPAGPVDAHGFNASATAADIRGTGNTQRLDLALITSSEPATAAAIFTTNDIQAAPVTFSRRVLHSTGTQHAIVVNSGNANACTGDRGMANAESMAFAVQNRLDLPQDSVFVCSTGRIGRQLPMDRILPGIDRAAAQRNHHPESGRAAAEAILTSDTRPKLATSRFTVGGTTVTIAGMAKGAGMIEPNMATMLAFLFTDAAVDKALLQNRLEQVSAKTFNAISVDGDMSTNDTVILMANGASGVTLNKTKPETMLRFDRALRQVCEALAQMIVADGERVTKHVKLCVEGAPDVGAAEKVARCVGNSLLVKTSWFGNDPNWGRILDAAGYARIGIDESRIDLDYDESPVLRNGTEIEGNLQKWRDIVAHPAFTIRLNLNLGTASFCLQTTDLSTGYVDFNKSE